MFIIFYTIFKNSRMSTTKKYCMLLTHVEGTSAFSKWIIVMDPFTFKLHGPHQLFLNIENWYMRWLVFFISSTLYAHVCEFWHFLTFFSFQKNTELLNFILFHFVDRSNILCIPFPGLSSALRRPHPADRWRQLAWDGQRPGGGRLAPVGLARPPHRR